MPGNIKVRILAGRGLPVMDRASETADAYVEVRFGQTTFKTDIFPKSLNPQWNSEWFKFEAEDEELQDEPLLLRVMDYDTYSANDAIGRVYIDLNPLLSRNGPSKLSGWLPIHDTLHGIRGEINLLVRVDLFTDTNRFRQSSCGIDFFGTPGVPNGYILGAVQGFVEELVVNDDPEYQWIDKIRTPRASNETRQLLFSKMSGELVRKIGKKAFELGGNAVIGYRQCFDLEGQSGIVVRGIGTSVTLLRDFLTNCNPSSPMIGELWHSPVQENDSEVSPGTLQRRRHSIGNTASPDRQGARNSTSESGCPIPTHYVGAEGHNNAVRQSSLTMTGVNPIGHNGVDSNYLPSGRRCSTSSSSSIGAQFPRPSPCRILPSAQVSIDAMEFPFFTLQLFPAGMVLSLGGVVSSRSVKLLDKIENADDAEERDGWWAELRTEVRSHMRALGCNAVIGYREETAIHEEICVLSSSGTAAVVDLPYLFETGAPPTLNTSMDKSSLEKEKEKITLRVDTNFANNYYVANSGSRQNSCGEVSPCHLCHIPYSENSLPFPVKIYSCQDCGRGKVPEILLTTIEPPPTLDLPGDPSLIQARLVRRKNDSTGETHAKEISDMLPFVEYELHSQLVSKLVAEGKNVVFGLRVDISLGETFLIGLATGTAYKLSALTPITLNRLKLPSGKDAKGDEAQKVNLRGKQKDSKGESSSTVVSMAISPATDKSNDSVGDMDLNRDKNTFLLEMDMDSGDRLPRLITSLPRCSNILSTPSSQKSWRQLQTLCRLFCTEIRSIDDFTGAQLSSKIDKLLTNTFFKFRRIKSFYMCNLQFSIILPEENEIQIGLCGVVLADSQEILNPSKQPLRQVQPSANVPPNASRNRRFSGGSRICVPSQQHFADDYQRQVENSMLSSSAGAVIFRMDEISDKHPGPENVSPIMAPNNKGKRLRSAHWGPTQDELSAGPFRPADIFLTPLLSWNDGAAMTYFGHYDFFFIRETNMLKELGGLNCFVHNVLCEVLHVVRAHVAAVNGHGMVAFRISDMKLTHNLSRNNAQLLISVSGDIVTTAITSIFN